jgi:hypothetical protein
MHLTLFVCLPAALPVVPYLRDACCVLLACCTLLAAPPLIALLQPVREK